MLAVSVFAKDWNTPLLTGVEMLAVIVKLLSLVAVFANIGHTIVTNYSEKSLKVTRTFEPLGNVQRTTVHVR